MSFAIHTNAPLLPLTRMVGDTATIEIGKAAPGDGRPDCFYGWAEAQYPHDNCQPHHILWGMDPEETRWTADVLATLGFQVVVTEPDTDDQFGDHHVAESMPHVYDDDAHSH